MSVEADADRTELDLSVVTGVAAPLRPVTTSWPRAHVVGDGAGALVSRYRRRAVVLDLLAGSVASVTGALFRFGNDATLQYVMLTALAPLMWVATLGLQRAYERRFLGVGPDEYRRVADAALVLFLGAAVTSFIVKGDLSRGYLLGTLPQALVLSVLGRRWLRRWLAQQRLAGRGVQKVLVVGRADAANHLIEQLDREPKHGLVVVGACVNPEFDGAGEGELGVPVVGDHHSILAAVDSLDVQVVAVASNPDLSGQALRRLAWALEERQVELVVSPGIIEVAGPRLSIRPVAGLSLLHLERPTLSGGRMVVKGVLDRVLSTTLVVVLSPLLLGAAVAVKLSSPGPVLFRQRRIGIDGEPFEMLKFRSMVADAEDRRADLLARNEGNEMLFKIKNDPRVTRVGALLRRVSIDELPQLWNVVRGDMALVGPRPPLPEEVEVYPPDAIRRLRVRPGITGLWQVSGRSDLSWEESLRLDLRYVDNWSLVLDLMIMARTFSAVLARSGAY